MMDKIRANYIDMMTKTRDVIVNIFHNITQEEATTFRDGGTGWTALEALCHVRDFDTFFHGRAVMMLNEDHPLLPGYDHEALAIERDYNGQDVRQVVEDFVSFRSSFIAFFEGLTEAEWARTGVHPQRGEWSMLAQVMQLPSHDLTHIEQITRTLAEKRVK
ncbi:MAG: hypothetical protein OHK0046_15250 [Anaerolineae bacterium]